MNHSIGTGFFIRSKPFSFFSTLFVLFQIAPSRLGAFTNDQAATVVVGQTSMSVTTNGSNGTAFGAPQIGCVDSNGKLFIVDKFNNRVLIYNSLPVTNGAAANVVVGQTTLTGFGSGTTSTTLNQPSAAYSDGTTLFIADQSNNRVLVYNSIPVTNGAAANEVIGQTSFTTSVSGCSATQLSSPSGVYSDGTTLFIADGNNNRIVFFTNANSLPVSNASAGFALGQPNLTTGAAPT